jgi:hypothetical protein
MRALAERSTPIFAFEPIKADLEGAFWDLAAPDAQPARLSTMESALPGRSRAA